MDNNLFDDLVASIKEAGAIKRNEVKASQVSELELPDIKKVREKIGLFNSHSGCPSNSDLNSVDNKKPRHPAGVFHIGLLSMTPVLPHVPGAIFLILVVWNILFSMASS